MQIVRVSGVKEYCWSDAWKENQTVCVCYSVCVLTYAETIDYKSTPGAFDFII